MFEERLAMNRQAVHQRKVMVECAMYELEGSLTTLRPGETPCLACLTPVPPAGWKRQFPVFGAVSGAVACMAAMEAIKVLSVLEIPSMVEWSRWICDACSFDVYKSNAIRDAKSVAI